MQALAGAVVGDGGVDAEGVLAVGKRKLAALDGRAVQGGRERVRDQVEGSLAGTGIEGDRGARAELLGASNVELDGVVDVGNEGGAVLRVGPSQICFHGPNILGRAK